MKNSKSILLQGNNLFMKIKEKEKFVLIILHIGSISLSASCKPFSRKNRLIKKRLRNNLRLQARKIFRP